MKLNNLEIYAQVIKNHRNNIAEIENAQTSESVSIVNHNSQSDYFIWINNTQTDELWFIMTDNDSQSHWFVEADNTQTSVVEADNAQTSRSLIMMNHNSQSDQFAETQTDDLYSFSVWLVCSSWQCSDCCVIIYHDQSQHSVWWICRSQ